MTNGMRVNHANQQLVLARQVGYACGQNILAEFQFPTVDKAWNEYKTLIQDEARAHGWLRHSEDMVERYFRQGYSRALNDKQTTRD